MIVNVIGNNGSGKTTVVKKVIAGALHSWPRTVPHEGRMLDLLGVHGEVYVPGRYRDDVGTGGCDTIKDVAALYDHVGQVATEFPGSGRPPAHVLYEGIRMMNHTRGVALQVRARKAGVPLHVVYLTTELEECLRRINERRKTSKRASGPLSMRDVEGNVNRARNYARKMRGAGAVVHHVGSDVAPALVLMLLQEAQS